MEYIYAALLLHKAGQTVDEAGVKKVLEAAGFKPEDGRVKALIAAVADIDIEKVIKEAAVPVAAPVAVAAPAETKEVKKEEKKDASEAAAGLGALFA
jgi:large subunit ribosomal protein L12